jgi:hypothetical protein
MCNFIPYDTRLQLFFSMAVASSVAFYGLYKKPPWPRQKLFLYGFGSAFITNDVGEVGVWGMRQRWMQRLENRRGFETAMNNIEARLKKEQMDVLIKRPNPAQTTISTPIPTPTPASPPSKDRIPGETPVQWGWQSGSESTMRSTPARDTSGMFLEDPQFGSNYNLRYRY